ncbi:hypothetical protein DNK08_06995 [Stutzerimonas kirkiae]|nr:hypothetical protein DNK08_06995 [Stutzerimonas kirkiae]
MRLLLTQPCCPFLPAFLVQCLPQRGQHLSASLTFAHSLERPAAIERGERPVHFRLDVLF